MITQELLEKVYQERLRLKSKADIIPKWKQVIITLNEIKGLSSKQYEAIGFATVCIKETFE